MSIVRRQFGQVWRLGLALVAVSASACASSGTTSKLPGSASRSSSGTTYPGAAPIAASPTGGQGTSSATANPGDAELVVHRDVVAQCPTLRLVRAHADEFDSDMVWLAVLDAIGDCMREDGPLARQNLGVSGDEDHRHLVRQVLASRGVAPTRVVATHLSAAGAAECQGGSDCAKRVEITIGGAASPK
jgi:hypothetical protein